MASSFWRVKMLAAASIAALLAACDRGGDEAPGFTKRAELAGFVEAARRAKVEPVPLFSAWAVPSGPLEPACFQAFLEKLETSLASAGKLDGIYLCLHGAMGAEGVRDPETRILERVRALDAASEPATWEGQHAVGAQLASEALAIQRKRGDPAGVTRALWLLGTNRIALGEVAEARGCVDHGGVDGEFGIQ